MSRRRKIIWLAALLVLAGGIGGFCWYWQSTTVDRKVRQLVHEAAGYPDTRTEKIFRKMKLDFLLKEKPTKRNDDDIEKELTEIGKTASPILVSMLNDENDEIRISASYFLRHVEDEKAFEPLMQALRKDKHPQVRLHAATALWKMGKIAVDPLIQALQKDDLDEIRKFSAMYLGLLGDSRAVVPLIQAMQKDEDYSVRRSCAQALGILGDSRAIEPLQQAKQKNLICEYYFMETITRLKSASTRPGQTAASSEHEK